MPFLHHNRKTEEPQGKTDKRNDKYQDLLEFCRTPRSRSEITEHLGMTTSFYAMQRYMQPLLKNGQLKMTIPEAPKSKNQKYVSVRTGGS